MCCAPAALTPYRLRTTPGRRRPVDVHGSASDARSARSAGGPVVSVAVSGEPVECPLLRVDVRHLGHRAGGLEGQSGEW